MFSRPFQADRPISSSSTISSEPCTLTPSSPLAASKGTHWNSVACQASAHGSGRVTAPTVAVSSDTLSVPAINTATSDSSTPVAAGPMLACSANKASVCCVVAGVVAPEQHRHQHADADAEQQAQHEARERELRAEDAAGVGEGQHVAGRREEQEGDRRPQPGTFLVDAGEQRHDGAGAHRQQRAGRRRGRVGHAVGRATAQPARDAGLGNQRGHGAGNEECRQQAQQHMGREVGGQVAGPAIHQVQEGVHRWRAHGHVCASSVTAFRRTSPSTCAPWAPGNR